MKCPSVLYGSLHCWCYANALQRIHMRILTHARTHPRTTHTHTHSRTPARTYAHTYAHTYTHIQTNARGYAHVHPHAHTHATHYNDVMVLDLNSKASRGTDTPYRHMTQSWVLSLFFDCQNGGMLSWLGSGWSAPGKDDSFKLKSDSFTNSRMHSIQFNSI